MKVWPRFREGCIRLWHGVLDYDTKRSAADKAAIAEKRDKARAKRMAVDWQAENERRLRMERRNQERMIGAEIQKNFREWNRKVEEARPKCQYCGGPLVPAYRNPNSASGCILLLVGICLTPFIIGIPVIIFALVVMGKSEKYMKCGSCGCS